MKKFYNVLLIAFLICTSSIFSQVKVGVGVGFKVFSFINVADIIYNTGTIDGIYFPIQLENGLRFEPEFGIYTIKQNTPDFYYDSIINNEVSSKTLSYGIGAFYKIKVDSTFGYYPGIRVGVMTSYQDEKYFPETKNLVNNNTKQLTYYLALVIGGEYLFSKHVSLGAELHLNYTSVGKPTTTPKSEEISWEQTETNSFRNTGIIFLRFYFN
ncbi:MAG: outer membrane beta-barrel protein [bacterium]